MRNSQNTATVTFDEALDSRPLARFSIAIFIVCLLVLVCDGMDAQLLGIVAPLVIEEYGVDRGTFGIAMSAALVGFGLGSWGGGWLGDTSGRRTALALATVLFSLATIGASWSGDVWQMAIWRLVGGVGFGAAYANAITLASEWLPERWRPIGVTTLSVGTPAGGLVVAALTPTMVEALGWRGTFIAIGAATLLVVLLIVFVLRDSPSFLMARDRVEAAHSAAGKVLEQPFALRADRETSDGTGSIGVFAPSNFRLNIGVGLAFAAATLVAYGILNWSTTFLLTKNLAFEQASYAVSVAGLTSIGGSIAVGALVQRFGTRRVQLTISTVLLASLVALAAVLEGLQDTPTETERLVVFSLIGLCGALFSGAIASFYALMAFAYPPSCRSAGIGFGLFVGRAGAIAASGLGGALIDLGAGSLLPFFAVLCLAAVLIFAAIFIVDRHVQPAAVRRVPA